MSKLDQYYRKLVPFQIYSGGWGLPHELSKIIKYRRNIVGKRSECQKLVSNDYPVKIDKEHKFTDHSIIEGSFVSPFAHYVADLMPEEIRLAKFQLLIPKNWKIQKLKPVVFNYAGTGDQSFWRRRLLIAKPLLNEHSVASLILENPFYGCRKPKIQERSNLIYVRDLFVMGGCLVTESLALMHWLNNMGFGPFVLTGFSMGGHMACLSSTVWEKPLALVPCLSWTTAGPVFTRGVMSRAVCWKILEDQFFNYKEYRSIRDDLKFLHQEENKKRQPHNQYINTFKEDFNNLKNFNQPEKKTAINMEVLEFMHLLMDECTHLLNFDIPCDTSLIKVISANEDCYILRDGVNDFHSIWPGCEVEYIDQGHVSAFLLSQNKFRQTIISMLAKMIKKHYSTV